MITFRANYNAELQRKYRLCYSGGRDFVDAYLQEHYKEDPDVWKRRKFMSYAPAFAKAALLEYLRGLSQRATEIKRVGGSPLYQDCISGRRGGVDGQDSTMNRYMVHNVLQELLPQGIVGVFCERVDVTGMSEAEANKNLPYYMIYTAEQILNYRIGRNRRLEAIMLRHSKHEYDEYGMPKAILSCYRYLALLPGGGVYDRLIDSNNETLEEQIHDLPEIPFTLFQLPESLLQDVADYQIALLNLASADLYYATAANVPFYVEQYNDLTAGMYNEGASRKEPTIDQNAQVVEEVLKGTRKASHPTTPDTSERIVVGAHQGRRYPMAAEAPRFIHPSPEPLLASMQKEQQLKNEIRELLRLALASLGAAQTSAEAKEFDELGLEGGLSYIAKELQRGETAMARHFHNYLAAENDMPTITYPDRYDLRTDDQRRAVADSMHKLSYTAPSATFRKQVAHNIADTLFGSGRVTEDVLALIHDEIDSSPFPTADPDIIKQDYESGFLSDESGSLARGYRPDECERARKAHTARLLRIQAAQTPMENPAARGLRDADPNPNSGKEEKEGKPKRGEEQAASPQGDA